MNWWNIFWIPADKAKEMGFTHHGAVYGIPSYLRDVEEDEVISCAKVPVLGLLAVAIDKTVDFMLTLMPEGTEYVTPIEIVGPL